jgi:Carboxypeptidase regulatory-like domain/TonB dependent receptor-like, beta-barrel
MIARAVSVLAATAWLVASAAAQDSTTFVGKPLAEALRTLQSTGVKLVFSSELVRPEMRVESEPKASRGEPLLRELLQPHGLDVKKGPRETWLVVAGKPERPKAPQKPAASRVPTAGAITGRVVDAETGQPIADVQVRLERTTRSLVTDSDGRFEIADVDEGTHTLSVSMVGYALARRQVLVSAAQREDLIVPLARGTGAYTDHVIVTAGKDVRGGAVSATTRTLESRQIQDLGTVLADDPLRAVQALPGVAWNDDFRAELSVRGNGPGHLGLSIDDVPSPWLVHSVVGRGDDTGSIGLINGDIVDRMTLSPGVRSSRLGERTGAWLETTIREGSRDATGVRGSISAAATSLVVEGPVGHTKRGSWLVSARQSYLDWLLDRVTNDEDETSIFGFTDGQAKFVFDLTPRQQLQFTFVGGRSRFSEDDQNTPGPNAIGFGYARTGLTTIGLRSTVTPSLLLTQRVWATGQRFQNVGRFGQELGRGSGREFGYRADVSWNPSASILVQLGGDATSRRESLATRHFSSTPAQPTPIVSDATVADASSSTTSGYAQLRWNGPGGVAISPGFKVTRASIIDDTFAAPWLEAEWTGGPSLHLRAAAGLYHQLPEVDQIRGTAGNGNLGPEQSRYLEVGVGQAFGLWRWELTAFNRRDIDYLRQTGAETRRIGNNIVSGNPLGPWQNALEGRTRGLEASLERRGGRWAGWLAYAYGESIYTDSVTDERFWGDYDQRHALNIYGSYQLSARTRASVRIRMGSNFPIPGYLEGNTVERLSVSAVRNQTRLPQYARIDFNVSRAFFWSHHRLTLFGEVMNVANRANYRATEGTILFPRGNALGFAEKLFPFLPVAGLMIEF